MQSREILDRPVRELSAEDRRQLDAIVREGARRKAEAESQQEDRR